SIEERIDDLFKNGEKRTLGFGPAIVTCILMDSNIKNYSLYNDATEKALKILIGEDEFIQIFGRKSIYNNMKGEDYKTFLKLMNLINNLDQTLDRIDLDYFFYLLSHDEKAFTALDKIKKGADPCGTGGEKHLNLSPKIKKFFDNLDELLEKKKQIIFYGPAGTGKTYFAINYAKNKENHEDHYKIITFHQSFSYEEFIEGIKPVVSNNSINYKVKDGIFKRCNFLAILLALKANKDKISSFMNSNDLEDLINYLKNDETINEEIEKRYDDFKKEVWKYIYKLNNENKLKDIFNAPGIPKVILIIDEINRGNISKIFGELITLIENDKRLGAENMILLNLPYSNEPFSIAPNLYIIGTMNTSDKSIALIDTALRRRFYFWEMKPDYDEINKDIGGINLRDLLKNLNEKIEKELDKDHVLGHSYFMLEEDSIEALYNTWYREIIPHLEEMFYGNYEKLSDVLGENFYKKNDDKGIYQLKTFKDDEFLSEFNKEKFIEALKNIVKPNDGK
ncbi:MAG: McrB family protein, partial [Thermoplasmata archaeon]